MSQNINDDKKQALDKALAQIEKSFGKGSIMFLADDYVIKDISSIPTGAINLDVALGIGGLPRGRIVEIYGPESSGKTTLALHTIAEAQKLGGIAAFIDAEHALDVGYAKNLGVNVENLVLAQPDTGEQALAITESLVRSNAVDIVVIDSVAALVPRAEIEGSMGDTHVGLLARLMSQALRKLTAIVSKTNCTVIFLNQLRQKIGVSYGNPETTTGGVALKFYSSIRLDIRKKDQIKSADEIIGNVAYVRVVKNKLAPPFKTASFDIMYGTGISKVGTILDCAVDLGIIDKAGSWYSFDSERLGQGRENVKEFLTKNEDVYNRIELKIREKLKNVSNHRTDLDGEKEDDRIL